MAESTRKAPVFLHAEQERGQHVDKKPWHRLDNEPAMWFLRFRSYCQIGRHRSLQAVLALEAATDKAIEGAEKKISDGEVSQEQPVKKVQSVPGAWSRASVKWHWHERAKAYDLARREAHQAKLIERLYDEAAFASRAMRVIALSRLATMVDAFLQEQTNLSNADNKHTFGPVFLEQTDRMRGLMTSIKTLQSLLKDIRKEMDSLDKAW